jgi:predicted metal-dependent hydrolase
VAEAAEKPDFRSRFLQGVEHFNSREFWEAHESWEELWLVAESEAEQFLQGMIQMAAAYHHVQRGTVRGAVRLFDAAMRRLSAFPPGYCGIDRSRVEAQALPHRAWASEAARRAGDANATAERIGADEYPRITVVDLGEMPPREQW